MAAPTTKPPITCHILDTTLGRPAPSIPVTLTLTAPPSTLSPSSLSWTSTTNSDGRITAWTPSSPFSADSLDVVFKRAGDQTYTLRFDLGAYWEKREIASFMPVVEVKFLVREGGKGKEEHYHVPVLVGPFGFTTYRGS